MSIQGTEFDFVEGDTLSKVTVQFKDDDGTAIDLTGGTAVLSYRITDDVTGLKSVRISRSMTVTSAAEGRAEYQFTVGELHPGAMDCEFIATTAEPRQVSTKRVTTFLVRRSV